MKIVNLEWLQESRNDKECKERKGNECRVVHEHG